MAKIVKLSSICEILDNKRIPLNNNDRENRIKNKRLDELYPYYGATKQVGFIDDYIFDDELILLGEDGVMFYDTTKPKAYLIKGKSWVNNHAHVLKIDNAKANTNYILYYLNIFNYQGYVSGSTRLKLNKSKMSEIPIPLPSLEQQKQIAKILDKANELIELRTESIKKLDALAKSIFIDMFGDPVSNPKKWKIRRIADLGKVQTGNTPPRAELDNYGNFIEWIKSDNILKDNITVAKSREYLSEKGYAKGRIVKSGSLLFTCIAGSMSSIGNLAITDREVTFNQQINSLTPFKNNELYLYSLFKLSKKYFEENSTKSMKIMINKSTFENLLFPIAPLDLQNKFAKIIEKIEEQKTLYTQELEKLQINFDALLQKSFQE